MAKHGAQDWAKYRPNSSTFPVQDLAELAVRLGSPVIYDRRGDVLLMDSFEYGFTSWIHEAAGVGASIALTPTTALHGGYCVMLTTGPVAPNLARIYRFVPYPRSTRFGHEYAFAYNDDVNRIWSRLALYDGTHRHEPVFRYDPQTQLIRIYTNDLVWIDVAENVILSTDPRHFHRVKLVFDTTTRKHVRLLVDNYDLDISQYTYHCPEDATNPKMQFGFYLMTNVDDNRSAYLDNVVITQDEP